MNLTTETRQEHRLTVVLLLFGLCALTVLVYFPGLAGDYVFDDRPNLIDNHRLDMQTLDMESLKRAALSSSAGSLRRPVSMLSFAFNRYYFGINPWSYKVINLSIHIGTGLLLFLCSRLLLKAARRSFPELLSPAAMTWLPLVVAGLWLLHPINLTSILYIIQRMTSLASLFMVAGICLYTAGRLRMLDGRRGMPMILAGLLGCGSLALFSKETGALLPVYLFIIEATLFRFKNGEQKIDTAIAGLFGIFLLLPGLFVLGWLIEHPGFFENGYRNREFTLEERLMTEARVVLFYLKMIIAPSITELGLYHDDIIISKGLLDPPATVQAILFHAVLLCGALLLVRKQPLFTLGILWFYTGHLLESTAIALEIAHEHRNYLAGYGILLALGSLAASVQLPKLRRLVSGLVPALFLALFSITTWVRAGQWSDNINHAIYEARHHPNSVRSVYAAGRIHSRLALEGVPGTYEKAQFYLKEANRINANDIMASTVLTKLAYLTDNPVDRAWIEEIKRRLPLTPVNPTRINSLKELLDCMDKTCPLPHEDMEDMFQLLLANPSLESDRRMSANAHTLYGFFTINIRNNYNKGVEIFHEAVRLEPSNPQWHLNLVHLLIMLDRLDEAEKQLQVFMDTETYGGGPADYQSLKDSLEERKQALKTTRPEEHNDNG